jgi:hypothetical protein
MKTTYDKLKKAIVALLKQLPTPYRLDSCCAFAMRNI